MVTVKDFAQFTEGLRDNWKQPTQVFLAELSQVDSEAEIERICLDTMAKLRQKWPNANTLNRVVGGIRKVIRAYQQSIKLTESNSFASPGGKDTETVDGRTHLALRYLRMSKDEHYARNAPTNRKTELQSLAGVPFNPFEAIEIAEKALNSPSYLERVAAFEFLTGRRNIEVLNQKGYKLSGRYTIEFSGQVKTKKPQPYTLYSLCEARKVIDAMVRFNREADMRELEGDSNEQKSKRRNSSTNAAVRRVFGKVLQPPVGQKHLSNHNLRAAYVQAASVLFKDPLTSMAAFSKSVLGHESVTSTVNYDDYVCLTEEGEEMPRGQWRNRLLEESEKPKSQEMVRPTIDKMDHERIMKVAGHTFKDKVAALLDNYERVGALETQVAELKRQVALLSATKAMPEKPDTQSDTHQTRLQPQIDWSQVTSEELQTKDLLKHMPGSAEEKIRRAIEAIKTYNEGKPQPEMYVLSEANVRYVSGSRHGSVKAYFTSHPELAEYNYHHGFTMQHDRGKPKIAEVISW